MAAVACGPGAAQQPPRRRPAGGGKQRKHHPFWGCVMRRLWPHVQVGRAPLRAVVARFSGAAGPACADPVAQSWGGGSGRPAIFTATSPAARPAQPSVGPEGPKHSWCVAGPESDSLNPSQDAPAEADDDSREALQAAIAEAQAVLARAKQCPGPRFESGAGSAHSTARPARGLPPSTYAARARARRGASLFVALQRQTRPALRPKWREQTLKRRRPSSALRKRRRCGGFSGGPAQAWMPHAAVHPMRPHIPRLAGGRYAMHGR